MGTALDNGTEWDDAQPIVQNVLRVVEEERGLTPVIEWLHAATMTNDVNKAIRCSVHSSVAGPGVRSCVPANLPRRGLLRRKT